jgi:hypothetical protein
MLPEVRMARHIARRLEPHLLEGRPALSYRACEFAAEAGCWPTIIGGLSIPYATIPMNKRTGITIGGTRYFIVFAFVRRTKSAAPVGVTSQGSVVLE